jgi:hypothetical protein
LLPRADAQVVQERQRREALLRLPTGGQDLNGIQA